MTELVGVEELLRRQREESLVLLDTRSPGEFAAGHIAGAQSLPLFSDAERARVGTIYKQVDPREALLVGLGLVGPRMRGLVEEAGRLAGADFGLPAKPTVGVYCWRGGSRSGSMAWLLATAGFAVTRLEGGYKAYRQANRGLLESLPFDLRVVDGPTGSGKTVLLAELARAGAQVLDLEAIAHHKGSAFGLTPGDSQPTTETAENEIATVLRGFDVSRPVWIENESRNVGRVFLPEALVAAMAVAPRIELVIPTEQRLDHIVAQYGRYRRSILADTFHRLRKRLGNEAAQRAIAHVDAGELRAAAAIALEYYDKTYAHYAARQSPARVERHDSRIDDLPALAQRLVCD